MDCRIRRATPQDTPVIAEIERNCFSKPWSEEDFKKCFGLENYRFFIAEREGEPLGYAGMYVCLDEADVATIGVLPRFRRQGVGRALMKVLLDGAEEDGIRTVFLEVRSSNGAAKALYESLGFRAFGIRKDYYEEPTEDAVLMKYERSETC